MSRVLQITASRKNYWAAIAFIVSILSFSLLYAQTGPGGVGNANGSSGQPENLMWLDASSLGLTNGAAVTNWTDRSGNGRNASAPSSLRQPSFRTNYLNGRPAIFFDNSVINEQDRLDFDGSSLVNTDYTILVVAARRTNGGSRRWIGGQSSTDNANLTIGWSSSTDYTFDQRNNGITATPSSGTGANVFGVFTHSLESGLPSNNRKLFQNGGSLLTSNSTTPLSGFSGSSIGRWTSQYYDIDVAEVIFYKSALNQVQRILVENYLSAKYSISLSANDFYTTNPSTHTFDLAGIGRSGGFSHTEANSAGMILTPANGTLDADGEFLIAGHANTPNTTTATSLGSGVVERWARSWYIDKTGTLDAAITFDFSEAFPGGKYPVDKSGYALLRLNGSTYENLNISEANKSISGDRITFTVSNASLTNGIYTLGSTNNSTSPVAGLDVRTWYSYQSGNWNDPDSWTLDGGVLPLLENPANEIPQPTDRVIITSGRTITMNVNNVATNSLEVIGSLDLGASTGHNFNTISGSGRIRMTGDNFPAANASAFLSAGSGGTVEIYGAGATISQSRTYNHLLINLSGSSSVVTLANNLTLNGNLSIQSGTLRINDVTTASRNITVSGNVSVEANGAISVSTANARHEFTMFGNFTNNGNVAFTNRVAADYNNEATDGIVDANFVSATQDQYIACNNTTKFYRIEINKGTDETYILHIDAQDPSYFQLLGYANQLHGQTAQLTANDNALGLLRGTVRIGSNVNIPVLNNINNYNISVAAQLWVDGGKVVKPAGVAIVPYGKIKVSSGSLEALVDSGITLRDNGSIIVEGGALYANQIRTSSLGIGNVGGYVQSGGTVILNGGTGVGSSSTGSTGTSTSYCVFNLTFPGNVFSMSGGTLHVKRANSVGGIFINSDASNVSVTGGTVIMEMDNATDFKLTSTAHFWNVIMRKTGSGTPSVRLEGNTIPDAGTVSAQSLVVKAVLSIEANTIFNALGTNVTIGNNLTIATTGTYTPGNNTTTFDGAAHSILTLNGTRQLYNFTVNKATETAEVEVSGGPLQITNALRVEKGVLRYNISTIEARGSVYNAGTIGLAGTSGRLIMNGSSAQTITVAEGNLFTNLELNNTGNFSLAGGNMSVRGTLTLTNGLFNIGTHKLTMQGAAANIAGTGFSATKMIQTAGNDSDGGLEMYVDAAETIVFPVGVPSKYTPASVVISSNYNTNSDDGYIQLNPVNEKLSTLNPGGSALDYYWRVRHSGFADVSRRLLVTTWSFTYSASVGGGSARPAYVIYEDDPNNPIATGSDTDPDIFKYERVKEKNGVSGATVTFDGEVDQINSQNNKKRPIGNFSLVAAKYTVADQNAVNGSLEIYYSRQDGNWNANSTWSRTSHTGSNAGDFPKDGDIAVIGINGSDNHEIRVVSTQPAAAAEVIFNPSTGRPKLVFPNASDGANPHPSYSSNFNLFSVQAPTSANPGYPTIEFYVNGNWNGTTFTLPNADYGDFVNYTNSEGEISEIAFNFPDNETSGSALLPTTITAFPDVRFQQENRNGSYDEFNNSLSGHSDFESRVIVLPAADISVRRLMRLQDGIVVRFSDAASGNATTKWLEFDSAEPSRLQFQATGTARTVTVDSLIEYTNNVNQALEIRSPATGTLQHNLIVNGSILKASGIFDLYSGDPASNTNAILTLAGENNGSFINNGGETPEMFRIVMNKGASQTPTFTFQDTFTLMGPTNGAVKALQLQNGRLILNDPDINIDLSTGGSDFAIPASAALEVTQGIVNVSGSSTGIALDGTLRINGGTVNVGICALPTDSDNNYIEYSASGSALLEVSSGILNVGTQIRRGLTSTAGVLRYRQTGGTVTIGTCTAASPTATRGMLEVLNTGSEFTHTNGTLTIVRQNAASTATPSLWLEPSSSSTTGSDIYLGNANTPVTQSNFNITSSISLNRLTLSGTNNPTFNLRVRPLSLNGELNINSGSTLNANGLQLTLGADFVNNGTFTPTGNTTVFSGTGNQQIRGSSNTTFYNLTKSSTTTLTLAETNASVDGTFRLLAGTFNDGSNTLTLRGNMVHDGTHMTPVSSSGQGILFAGTSRQELSRTASGTSTFGRISVDNPAGVVIPDGDGYGFDVTDALRLKTGVLDIGGSLLTLTESASIEAVNPFGSANMIQTNSSFTDNGLRKRFNTIGSATTFTFPVGHTKYTPVVFNITSSSAGSLTVRPANERHPSVVEDTETVTQITDADNVLQYHWIVKASGISGFSGTATMSYNQNDVRVTSPYTETDYIPAFIYSNNTFWDKSLPTTNVDESANTILFPFTNVSDANLSGDYTAGIPDAIPNQIPQYETAGSGGDYTAQATWTPLNGSPAVVNGVGPVGAIITVKANDQVMLNSNNIRIYRTTIESGGALEINGTLGHRLGELSGTGTLRLVSNTASVVMPAGNYETFFSCATGGTLEYGGSGNYEVLGGIASLRNLTISGTGTKTMSSTDLTVCNDLRLTGATLTNNSSRTVNVQRDMLLQGGSYSNLNGTLNVTRDLLLSNASSTFDGGTGGNKTITRNLTISDGTLQVGSGGSVSVRRNLTYSGGTFNGGSSTAKMVMSGTTAQTMTGNFTGASQFHKLEINNSSTGVTLAGNADINNELLLTRGLLRPGANNLTLNQNAFVTPSIGKSNSYVNGRMRKVIPNGGSFTFPVGKGRWGYVGVSNVSSSSTLTWQAEYFTGNADTQEAAVTNLTPSNNGSETIQTISVNEYWKITDDAGAPPFGTVSAQILLRWNTQSNVSANTTEHSDLRVMYWNSTSSNWDNAGGASHTGTQALGSFNSVSPVTFSEKIITLGSTDLANPLPVELVSFTVKMQEQDALLQWETASERNNDFFEIQRSINGQDWTSLGFVEGAGDSSIPLHYTFTDEKPLYGLSYYRLRQVDFDGAFEYSQVISLENVQDELSLPDPEILLYPNPGQIEKVYVRVLHLKPFQEVSISLADTYGRQFLSETVSPDTLEEGHKLNVNRDLPAGIYIVTVKQADLQLQKKLIIRK